MGLSPLQPGDPRRAGAYAIRARLGSGGMGQVFLADGPRGERVAVKVLHPHIAADGQARARLARELRTLSRVRGPHLAEVVDSDVEAPRPFLVTQYIPGRTLDEHVATGGPLDDDALLALARGLAEALATVHAVGVVHRDLKPANVICGPDGPTLLDFGIASAVDEAALTRTGEVWGTPAYLAPEQVVTGRAEPASDVHALGATLAHAATGTPLFGSGRADAVLYRVVHDTPALPALPGPLAALLPRMLARQPQDRPTAAAVLEALAPARTSLLTAVGRQRSDPAPTQALTAAAPAHLGPPTAALPATAPPATGLPVTALATAAPPRPAPPASGSPWAAPPRSPAPRPESPYGAPAPPAPRDPSRPSAGPTVTAGPWVGRLVGVLVVLALAAGAFLAPLAVPLATYAVGLPLHDALGRTHAAALERRARRGPRATDGLRSTVGLAAALVRALLGAALRLPLLVLPGVAAAGIGCLGALAWGADGTTALRAGAALLTATLGAWLLSAGRHPPAAAARADLRRRGGVQGAVATGLALVVLTWLLLAAGAAGGEPVWFPLADRPALPDWVTGLPTIP